MAGRPPHPPRAARILTALIAWSAAALAPGEAPAQNSLIQPRMQIYAGPLHREYLGCLNCGLYDVHSVWNGYGPFGWDNDYRKASHFAVYWMQHGRYSACDPFAADPPILIDDSRHEYGRLNVSATRADSICGPNGTPSICDSLRAMCKRSQDPPQ